MTASRRVTTRLFAAIIATCLLTLASHYAVAANTEALNQKSEQALAALVKKNGAAAALSKKAEATLVFPNIIKAGFVFGGAYGEGVLIQNGQIADYYNSVSASWGWQIGAQSYAYVVFLMTDKAVNYLEKSNGWEVGTGPSLVAVKKGVSKNLTTTTLKDDAYAFITDQQGLMADVSIEGTKISKIK